MTTSTDITNRALQLIGTRTTIASLTEQSNEAIQANLVYNNILNWCFGIINWNFARNIAVLTLTKSATSFAIWSSTAPAPPWLYEFTLPSDYIRAQYAIDATAVNSGNTSFTGEPVRAVIAFDTILGVQQAVLLSNTRNLALIYTALISNPSLWNWSFERFMVHALASTLSRQLTGDKELVAYLDEQLVRQFMIADQANREEGLIITDSTPEWIQAIGIRYPKRQIDDRLGMIRPQQTQQVQRDNSR